MKSILKVVSKGQVINVNKADGTTVAKCTLVLQEIGGQYEDAYVVTVLGQMAQWEFRAGEVYAASLRFMTHEYNGTMYQDIMLNEFVRVG